MDPKPYEPYVPADTRMKEFTVRAVILGVVLIDRPKEPALDADQHV